MADRSGGGGLEAMVAPFGGGWIRADGRSFLQGPQGRGLKPAAPLAAPALPTLRPRPFPIQLPPVRLGGSAHRPEKERPRATREAASRRPNIARSPSSSQPAANAIATSTTRPRGARPQGAAAGTVAAARPGLPIVPDPTAPPKPPARDHHTCQPQPTLLLQHRHHHEATPQLSLERTPARATPSRPCAPSSASSTPLSGPPPWPPST